MSASGSVPSGTRVGRYEIVSLLRQGGMGEVYAARDSNLGRRVALKILPKHRTSDPDRVARFVREAQASSTLNHPSIVSVHDAGSEGDVHFLAMELIDGEPLSEWARKRRGLAAKVDVMAQVADGLARAHDAGIVHRDLKPDNIMVTRDGLAKIVDFGIAKLTERLGERAAVSGVTTPTSRVGTTAYMSPEQIEGKSIDRRTDVFAFGIVLHEIVTGTNPFAAEQYADTIHNVVHLDPPLERVPAALRRIVRRCLRKEPERRYDSMRDVALDLRESIDAIAENQPRRTWIPAAAALLVVALAALTTWYVLSRREAKSPAMTMTRLTNTGHVSTAAISPDGKYLVHAVEEGSNETLYVKQIATGTMTRIAEPAPVNYFMLRVSPDGNYAYYVAALRSEPNVASVFQIPLLGGAPRKIANDTEFWFSISPDGTRIAFRRFNAVDREHRLTIAPVDGGAEEIVLARRHPEFIDAPLWTPDGKAITFVSGKVSVKNSSGMFRLDLATHEVVKMATPEFPGVGSYAWLPDGSGALVTVNEREQPPQVWFVPAGQTSGRKVTSEISAYYALTPTADSRSFSAVRDATDSNIFTIRLDDKPGQPLRAVTTGAGNWFGGGGVRWLSDREVAFSSPVPDNTFFVADAAGGATRRLIHNMPMWQLAVSPDRTRIAFVSGVSGSPQVWLAEPDGSNPRQLTHGSASGAPSFTPDGKSIVFMRTDEGQFAWRVPVGGGEPERVTNVPTGRPLVSPDGTWLLCRTRSTGGEGPLWRTTLVPFGRAGEPRYFHAPRFGGPPMMQWHPKGDAFLYVDFKDGVANLWLQKIDGGEPRQVTFFEDGQIFSFGVAPDGERVALSRGQWARDAVLIKDFR